MVRRDEQHAAAGEEKKKGMAMSAAVDKEADEDTDEEDAQAEVARTQAAGRRSSWPLFTDPESKRKRRVASYKAYHVPGKLKASLAHSVRWLKCKYTHFTYTW